MHKRSKLKTVLVGGIMDRLRPISKKSSISYDDLNIFCHLIEFVLKAKEREPGFLIIHDDGKLKLIEDTNHNLVFDENTIPVGLETAIGSEYPVKIMML